MIFLLAAVGLLRGQAPIQPTLPQRTVSLALPMQGTSTCPTVTGGSNCVRYVLAGNAASFQSAINASTCGDTIVLVAGSTYKGNFTIPATSCSGWIAIESSALGSLPPSGTRVGPSNVASMATISTPNASPAIQFTANSNHWRLIGLEITTSFVSTMATVYYLVGTGESLSVQSQLPSYLILDRIYLHGLPTSNVQHGIGMDTQSIGIVDSFCDEIHHNEADSQCFFSYNGTGPFLIQNNFIQAAGENIMFGGADPSIVNLVPSDITIVGNLIQKNIVWNAEAAPYNWIVKNHFELKNAQRVLFDGNVLQYTWNAAQSESIILRGVNQSGNCTWCVVQDVTVTHNLIQHAPSGIVIANPDTNYPALTTARLLVENNVLTDINSVNWGAKGWGFFISLDTAGSGAPVQNITINHNTVLPDQADVFIGDNGSVTNLRFTNNLWNHGSYGLSGNGVAEGTATLSFFAPGYVYMNNVFIVPSGSSTAKYPSGTFWQTQAGVQFTNFAAGNYRVLSSSPYHNAGTDGKDIGAWDWSCLNYDWAATLAGNFVPSPGCALSGNLPVQPPTNLNAVVQ